MAREHWSIVIVPPGTEVTRTIRVSPRARRGIIIAAGVLATLVTSAIITLFTPYSTPTGRLMAAENEQLHAQLTRIDRRLLALNDTLAALGVRDAQLRLMAGMPVDSSSVVMERTVAATDPAGAAGVADGVGLAHDAVSLAGSPTSTRFPKPFLGRLGFTPHADVEGMITHATALSASLRAVSDTLTRNFERLASLPSIMPTTGWLSSHFSTSRFHPILHESRAHEGIDVSAPMGSPIIAPAAGRIKSAGYAAGYGNTFEIDHANGIVTKFAHCSRIVVRTGDQVKRGQVVAMVGNTGLSTGPHLHYEVHVNGHPVDPLRYVVLPGKIAD